MPDERLDGSDLPLDELRRAWERLETPRPEPELEDCDPRTRAAVAWMQAAWSRVEAPAPRVPLARPALRPQPWMLPLAAAAGVLLALAVVFALQRLGVGVRPADVDTPIAAQPASQGAPAPRPDDAVELAALAPDRVELRSGPVRLILLTGGDSPQFR